MIKLCHWEDLAYSNEAKEKTVCSDTYQKIQIRTQHGGKILTIECTYGLTYYEEYRRRLIWEKQLESLSLKKNTKTP